MAWITNEFDGYWFRIHARESSDHAAHVFCRNGPTTVAWLIFRYGETGTQAAMAANGTPLLYYPASMLGPMLETLRSEKPLYVHMNPDIHWGYVTSSVEPVGEEEESEIA
jgi:hypothetical protein